jgi:hypothetical protein
MRGLLAVLLAALLLTGCANAGAPPRPASPAVAGGPAASAPFYLQRWQETGPPAVTVINGFTGHAEAAITAPAGAGSFPWYPCGAAPDDRTFLLCDTGQYYELRLGDDGKPHPMTAPADIPVAAQVATSGYNELAVSPDRRLAAVVTATGITVLSLATGVTRSWAIPAADGQATDLSWAGDRYVAFQFLPQSRDNDAGGVRVLDTRSAATAALTASRLVISSERKLADGITGLFNPVITPDGSKIVTAAWTGFLVAELAEFSARTGRLIAVLKPAVNMPGHGFPCQVLWTDPSGSHLIAYCGTPGVVNGTRFTPVHLHVPEPSGPDFTGTLLW